MKAVVDANVCVSAVLSAKGTPARILDHALGSGPYDFELCAPSQFFQKIQDVLVRPRIAGRLQWSPAEVELYARRLRLAVSEVPTGGLDEIPAFTRDPEDNPYVLAAILSSSSYLISGDGDILEMEEPPVTVVSPAQFVRLWHSGLL